MDGMRPTSSDSSTKATQSPPLGDVRRNEGRFGQSRVTHTDVTSSLLVGQILPRLHPQALDDRGSIYKVDPETSLSDQLRSVEDSILDGEGVEYVSFKNSDSEGLSETSTGESLVEQSLTAASLKRMMEADPEPLVPGSLNLQGESESGVNVVEPDDEEDDDDDLFLSASNVPFDQRREEAQKMLEQSVLTSMIPSQPQTVEMPLSTRITTAWQSFSKALNDPSASSEEALYQVLELYPAITDQPKVTNFLLRQTAQLSPEETLGVCQGFLKKFQVAGEQSLDDLTALDRLPDHDAIQILMIMRQKALHEGSDVEVIERTMRERLLKAHGEEVKEELGLNFDEGNADYHHYSKLSDTLGVVRYNSRAQAGAPIISPDKEWVIELEPGFKYERIVLSGESVKDHTIKSVIGHKTLAVAGRNPRGPLSELIKLDSWLATDQAQENTITKMMSEEFSQPLKEKGIALNFWVEPEHNDESDSDETPAASLNAQALKQPRQDGQVKTEKVRSKKRVRFNDQPDVVPREMAIKGKEAQAKIEDLVPLDGREKASHLTREYVEQLTHLLQSMDKQVQAAITKAQKEGRRNLPEKDNRAHHSLLYCRELAAQCSRHPAETRTQRYQLLEIFDNAFDADAGKPVGSRAQKRRQWVRNHPSVKSGLVSGHDLLSLYESHLSQMIVRTIDVAYSKAIPGRELYKLNEVSGRLQRGRHKRGTPAASDIMASIDPVTHPFDQAMELDISSSANFCQSLIGVQDPKVMLALRARLDVEKKGKLYVSNWKKRMKEVMCQFQAQQIVQSIDSQVRRDTSTKYTLVKNFPAKPLRPDIPKDPHDYATGRTKAYINHMVKEVLQGKMTYPGITNANYGRLQKTWDAVSKPAGAPVSVGSLLRPYMPSPEELLEELAGQGVVNKVKVPAPAQKAQKGATSEAAQTEEDVVTWIANTISGWLGWK